MRGSIQKKGPTYYAVIAVGGKRKWFKGGHTKKDAQRVLTGKQAEIDNGVYKEIRRVTFREFADLWVKGYVQANLKPASIHTYRYTLEKLLQPVFGDWQLTAVTTVHLHAYVAERLGTVSPRTVCNELAILKELFKHAQKWGYTRINPADHVDWPRVPKGEIEILEPHEVTLLLAHVDSYYRLAFLVAVTTGMRAGELWAVRWGDIDWNTKQIYVRQTLWKGQFQTPKSPYSIRRIDMPDSLVQELRKWKLACPIGQHDLIFPNREGAPTKHGTAVARHFNPALGKAKLRHVSFHSLRHTNASIRIQAGQNVKYLSSQLGHSTIKITLDIYGHLFNDPNFSRQQVDLLQNVFNPVRNSLENISESHTEETAEAAKPLSLQTFHK